VRPANFGDLRLSLRVVLPISVSFDVGARVSFDQMKETSDVFDIPLVFLRIGWMHRYRGLTKGDTITSGGAFVVAHGYGHETASRFRAPRSDVQCPAYAPPVLLEAHELRG